jgi:two-component system, LytTR family, sensor kinase
MQFIGLRPAFEQKTPYFVGTTPVMNPSFLHRKLFWGIKVWQALAFLAFYLFFAFQYWLAIWYTSDGRDSIWREVLMDYFLLKIILTLPLWWLLFIFWKNKAFWFKLVVHVVASPLWVFCWFHSYRFLQDLRGEGYLRGSGIWWDVYIPFLVYCMQFAIFHVYDFYLQTQKQKQKEKLLMQTAYNSEVNALKAQIQPHFLFNTLNSISASVPVEMEHTRELIAKLADTFRYSLQASEQEWISLKEELDFTKVVLDLEQERLKKRLTVIYNIDGSLLPTPVPPMLLQPIVENAIKHGIAPKLEGGAVTVTIEKQQQHIHIAIADTGVGYAGELNESIFNKGIGLRNTNMRLEKLYGRRIQVTRNQPSGLIFSFYIPLK